ncbi:uncharacterized protein [Cebidichthys violaceus]|uniref:uncharacterized protein n=1 Tax=Cebidichthys violaceus TaxID=271503 RepID=UPI0035C955E1
MDRLRIFLVILQIASCSHDWISGSVLEATVRPGDNITLYCDCKLSSGVYIVWYRNCSHENQPSLVLEVNLQWSATIDLVRVMKPLPRFHFVKNYSSDFYDLMIINTTDSDEGLYYCGTGHTKVEDNKIITSRPVYRYGNITTRILFDDSEPRCLNTGDCGMCWMLLYSLCPAFAVLSSVFSSLLVYQKTAKEPKTDVKRPDARGQTSENKDEDVCYAALEIRQASQRPQKKKKMTQSSAAYSVINTCDL